MHSWLFALLLSLICVGSKAQTFRVNLENEAVRRYLSEVRYTSADDESRVADYCTGWNTRLDWPVPLVVNIPEKMTKYALDGSLVFIYSSSNSFDRDVTTLPLRDYELTIYNMVPGTTYFYTFLSNNTILGVGRIVTQGQLRMIYAPSVLNVRDIGGWPTADGRRVRYGKIFRGGELNGRHVADATDLTRLRQLGVAAEIDLRADYEEEHGVSAFGFTDETTTPAGQVPSFFYSNDSGQLPEHITRYAYLYRWRRQFQFIVRNLQAGRAIYQHCRYGADRTGYLSLLLEGLLGLDYDSLIKDYELTSFISGIRKKERIDPVIEYIESLGGNSLQEKFQTFWLTKVGVSQADINYFMSAMLEGEAPVVSGIADVEAQEDVNNGYSTADYYDMQGHRMDANRLSRGLYIMNGRKVVVR